MTAVQRSLAWGRDERAAALSAAVAGRGASDEYPEHLLTDGRPHRGVRAGGESEMPEAHVHILRRGSTS